MEAYFARLSESMTRSEEEAAARQSGATAASIGAAAVDHLNETASVPARLAFLNSLAAQEARRPGPRVALATTTGADLLSMRRELLPWLQYHTALGVAHFYVLYDGQDAAAVAALEALHHVTVFHIHPPWASAKEEALAAARGMRSGSWTERVGNYRLMAVQAYCESLALETARRDGMDWMLHLDPDELFYPASPAFSIRQALAIVPSHVASVRFLNHEGQPEAMDLTNKYEQVTLFRRHKHWVTPEAHVYRSRLRLGGADTFLLLYANGKAAVRVDAPGVRSAGPHFFDGDASPRWRTATNPTGAFSTLVSDAHAILHYVYSYVSDVRDRARRSCPPAYLTAVRAGDTSSLADCLIIPADREAFVAAAQGEEQARKFFAARMVLSEGSRIRCRGRTKPAPLDGEEAGGMDVRLVHQQEPVGSAPQDRVGTQRRRAQAAEEGEAVEGWCTLHDIDRFKYLTVKLGLYERIAAPSVLLKSHEREIQQFWLGREAGEEGRGGSQGVPPQTKTREVEEILQGREAGLLL
ncbi:hypothetical protein H632_c2500p0 [Helicosporidium sp. ATCC 50920]|nr:hypothetical protein H632_c2500p0 [Helicosporidium sp. ATCC 50920]|eukprot:KDD73134.1 hypothetical protein H632_c2500p0 [Helicosporidium sp. ATCC 50920]